MGSNFQGVQIFVDFVGSCIHKKIIHEKFNFYTDIHTTNYATKICTTKFLSFTIHENFKPSKLNTLTVFIWKTLQCWQLKLLPLQMLKPDKHSPWKKRSA